MTRYRSVKNERTAIKLVSVVLKGQSGGHTYPDTNPNVGGVR